MNNSWSIMVRCFKRGLAASLFALMLLGASAAALSILAAGIHALSSQTHVPTSLAPTVGEGTWQGAGVREGQPIAPSSSTNKPAVQPGAQAPLQDNSGTGWVDALNHQLDHMQSPVGHSLDAGGVALGERVQKVFGHVLSGVLNTLFFEQSSDNSGGAQ